MKCQHKFTNDDGYQSTYMNKCDYCGKYIPYCSNLRGGNHKINDGKCDYCSKNASIILKKNIGS